MLNPNPTPQTPNYKHQITKPVNQNQQIAIKITGKQVQTTTIQHNMYSHIKYTIINNPKHNQYQKQPNKHLNKVTQPQYQITNKATSQNNYHKQQHHNHTTTASQTNQQTNK